MAAAHRVPQDPIEAVLGCAIDLLEIHLLGPLSKLFHERIEDGYRTWVHLIQRYIRRNTLEGPRVGGVLKAIEHRRGASVELIHRWQSEYLLDRTQDACGVVLRAYLNASLSVGAYDVGRSAIPADMVPAGLRVILDRENRHLAPELRSTQAFDNPTHGQVTVGHASRRGWAVLGGTAGMIVWQTDDSKLGVGALLFELREFFEYEVSTELVWDRHVPANVSCR